MGNVINIVTDLYSIRKFSYGEKIKYCRRFDIKSDQQLDYPNRFISKAEIEFINGETKTFNSQNIKMLIGDINRYIDEVIKLDITRLEQKRESDELANLD